MEDVVPVFADAPAELDAVALVDDAAFPGFLLTAEVHVPFAGVGEGLAPVVILVQDRQVQHLDVAEILPGEVPLRDPVAGVQVPDLVETGHSVGIQGDRDVQVADLLFIGKGGKGRNQCRHEGNPALHS